MTLRNTSTTHQEAPIKHSEELSRSGLLDELFPCVTDEHVSRLSITPTIWNGIQTFVSNDEILNIEIDHRYTEIILVFEKHTECIKNKILKLKVGEIKLTCDDAAKGRMIQNAVRNEFDKLFCQYDEKHHSIIFMCEYYYNLNRARHCINILLRNKTQKKHPKRHTSKQIDEEAVVEVDNSNQHASCDLVSPSSQLVPCDLVSPSSQLAPCDHVDLMSPLRQLGPCDHVSSSSQLPSCDNEKILSPASQLELCDNEDPRKMLRLGNCMVNNESETKLTGKSCDQDTPSLSNPLKEGKILKPAADTLVFVQSNDNVTASTVKIECVPLRPQDNDISTKYSTKDLDGIHTKTMVVKTKTQVKSEDLPEATVPKCMSSKKDLIPNDHSTRYVVTPLCNQQPSTTLQKQSLNCTVVPVENNKGECHETWFANTFDNTKVIQTNKVEDPPEATSSKCMSSKTVPVTDDRLTRYVVTHLHNQTLSTTVPKQCGSLMDSSLDGCDEFWFSNCEKQTSEKANENNNIKCFKSASNHILQRSPSSPTDCKRLLSVEVIKGDITKDTSHAIVNSSDQKLQNKHGVGSRLVKVAGSVVSEELQNYLQGKTEVPVTSVVVTRPGSLQCRHLFHAVGPRWRDYKDKTQCCHDLCVTIIKCLFEAYRRKLVSIAFPAVCGGGGLFGKGVPKQHCAQSYIKALKVFESKISRGSLRRVRFVDTNSSMTDAIQKELDAEWDRPFDFVTIDPWDNILDLIISGKDVSLVRSNTDIPDSVERGEERKKCEHSVSGHGRRTTERRHRLDVENSEDTGLMPPGRMTHFMAKGQLPGYQEMEHIVIEYTFEDGVQTAIHPRPGLKYSGSKFTSFLPSSREGCLVLGLLQTAFSRKLLFTVGKQSLYSEHYAVTWGGISQKRNKSGGPAGYGYPDPDYLTRVRKEMARFGIKDTS